MSTNGNNDAKRQSTIRNNNRNNSKRRRSLFDDVNGDAFKNFRSRSTPSGNNSKWKELLQKPGPKRQKLFDGVEGDAFKNARSRTHVSTVHGSDSTSTTGTLEYPNGGLVQASPPVPIVSEDRDAANLISQGGHSPNDYLQAHISNVDSPAAEGGQEQSEQEQITPPSSTVQQQQQQQGATSNNVSSPPNVERLRFEKNMLRFDPHLGENGMDWKNSFYEEFLESLITFQEQYNRIEEQKTKAATKYGRERTCMVYSK